MKTKNILLSLCLLCTACQAPITEPIKTIPSPTASLVPSISLSATPSSSITALPSVSPSPSVTPIPSSTTPTPSPSSSIALKIYTTIFTIAGTGNIGEPDLNLYADQISFRDVGAIAVDSQKNIYMAITDKVIKISDEFTRQDKPPYRYLTEWVKDVDRPQGLFVDSQDNLYVADTYKYRILKVNQSQQITVIAGNTGRAGYSGDGGQAVDALLSQPIGICTDKAGNLYIADKANHRIRKIDINGKITTIAGIPEMTEDGIKGGFSGDGGYAIDAKLNSPISVAVDEKNNVYLVDLNTRVRRIDSNGIITTVAGTGTKGFNYDKEDQLATVAHLNMPQALSISPVDKLLYIADTQNNIIRRLNSDGTIKTVVGNLTSEDAIGDYGDPLKASVGQPTSFAFDKDGNMYVYDSGHRRIRFIK